MAGSSDTKGTLLPTYFVADESGSMKGAVQALNEGLTSLHDAVGMDGMLAAKLRLSVIGFAEEATCHLPMSDLREVRRMPRLSADGGTSYSNAFREVRRRIVEDVDNLKREGYKVHRPVVFFLTDGQPTDEGWEQALAELTGQDFRQHPNMISFGLGDVDAETLLEVATRKEFALIAGQQTSPGKAIASFFETLTQSLVASTATFDQGAPTLVVPPPDPESGIQMALDYV